MEEEQSLCVPPTSNSLYDHVSSTRFLGAQGQNKVNRGVVMSDEELKIRGELEMDIERDLEEELKDGIYHLALRLHRLYQHQKERNEASELSKPGFQNQQGVKNKTLSEVNISIKMEGGTKIEFKEVKKETPERTRPRTSRTDVVVPASTKRFDWAKSLRGATPVAIDKKNGSFDKAKVQRNNPSVFHNSGLLESSKRNSAYAIAQRKEKPEAEKTVLELGWRD